MLAETIPSVFPSPVERCSKIAINVQPLRSAALRMELAGEDVVLLKARAELKAAIAGRR